MSDERRKDIAKQHGLPENLSADEVASALEGAAAAIRQGESHEDWLAEVIRTHRAAKPDMRRLIEGEGEG